MENLSSLCDVFFQRIDAYDHSLDKDEMLCFRNAMGDFCQSGSKGDAFVVYYCYCEIFHLFGEGYDNTQKLLELLADHEYHSGKLLTKHRDHYSHSAYVFALGVAIYTHDSAFRETFNRYYQIPKNDYVRFLYLWGMVSLFHDIGYPFQLAHEQVKAYTTDVFGEKNPVIPFVSFGNMQNFISLSDEDKEYIQSGLCEKREFSTIDEVLAYGLKSRVGYDEATVVPLLHQRVVCQPKFMDHGYFGAVLLLRQLLKAKNTPFNMSLLDSLTAILLHNNFNKFDYKNSHPISAAEHPLSYLLLLCDELQNWDRKAYGYASKQAPIAWDFRMSIWKNNVRVQYIFDSRYVKGPKGIKPILNKSYAKVHGGEFIDDIYSFVDTAASIKASTKIRAKEKKTKLYASSDSFVNLCDFAKAIHATYLKMAVTDKTRLNESFGKLSLAKKVSNIQQAKSYAKKLELINCFYSDQELDYQVVDEFVENYDEVTGAKTDDLGFLCREEHMRWVKERLKSGWHYGTSYINPKTKKEDRKLREKLKEHKDIIPYELLAKNERQKDEEAVKKMIEHLYTVGKNIRVYRYRYGRKPDLEIAGVGHRHLLGDKEEFKKQIREILLKYKKDFRVIVRSTFSYGAEQLIAETANELDITIKAVLPVEFDKFFDLVRSQAQSLGDTFTEEDELKLRHLLAQTVVCSTKKDGRFTHLAAEKYVIGRCDKVIAIWDGLPVKLVSPEGKPINQGVTYHCLEMARLRGLTPQDIHIISCER